jgi:large subunit ribosomal protein L6
MEAAAVQAPKRLSRVGKRPVAVPKGVTLTINGRKLDVQGPKGKLSMDLPPDVTALKDGESVRVESSAAGRDGARLQGLGRALIASMLKGASVGFETILELVGTGYRCEVKGKAVHLNVGLSHTAIVPLDPAVNAVVPPDSKGTQLVLTSANKGLLGQTAATIRAVRPPEPYGGKGIRYRGEQIRRKAGKAAKAKGAK